MNITDSFTRRSKLGGSVTACSRACAQEGRLRRYFAVYVLTDVLVTLKCKAFALPMKSGLATEQSQYNNSLSGGQMVMLRAALALEYACFRDNGMEIARRKASTNSQISAICIELGCCAACGTIHRSLHSVRFRLICLSSCHPTLIQNFRA